MVLCQVPESINLYFIPLLFVWRTKDHRIGLINNVLRYAQTQDMSVHSRAIMPFVLTELTESHSSLDHFNG